MSSVKPKKNAPALIVSGSLVKSLNSRCVTVSKPGWSVRRSALTRLWFVWLKAPRFMALRQKSCGIKRATRLRRCRSAGWEFIAILLSRKVNRSPIRRIANVWSWRKNGTAASICCATWRPEPSCLDMASQRMLSLLITSLWKIISARKRTKSVIRAIVKITSRVIKACPHATFPWRSVSMRPARRLSLMAGSSALPGCLYTGIILMLIPMKLSVWIAPGVVTNAVR